MQSVDPFLLNSKQAETDVAADYRLRNGTGDVGADQGVDETDSEVGETSSSAVRRQKRAAKAAKSKTVKPAGAKGGGVFGKLAGTSPAGGMFSYMKYFKWVAIGGNCLYLAGIIFLVVLLAYAVAHPIEAAQNMGSAMWDVIKQYFLSKVSQ